MALVRSTSSESHRTGSMLEIANSLKVDDILQILGEFGKYQKINFCLLSLPMVVCAMHALSWVLLAPKVATRCQLPTESATASYAVLPNGLTFEEVYPKNVSQESKYSQCERYDLDYTQSNNSDDRHGAHDKRIVSCNGKYVYDTFTFSSSARVDFELVCDRKWMYTMEETAYKSGVLVGSLLFGDLSDRFGRRPILLLCFILQFSFGILAGIAQQYVTFITARAVVGGASMGVVLITYVMIVEMVGPPKRMFVSVINNLFWTGGCLVAGVLSYLNLDWRLLQLFFSIPTLFFASYYWLLPESFRWLINTGKEAEGKKILRRVAKVNNALLKPEHLQALQRDHAPRSKNIWGFFQLFEHPRLAGRTLVIFFCWFVISGMYYGLSLNTPNLGGNPRLNFLISGAIEIPGTILNFVTLDRFGRQRVLCSLMTLGGLFLMATCLVPEGAAWLTVVFAMIGKMCVFSAFGAIYILSAELYPTVIRNGGMGASSLCARVGSISSDYVLLLGDIWKPLPLVIFGSMSITAGILCLTLPETLGKRLPETIEDAKKFGRKPYANTETELICRNNK